MKIGNEKIHPLVIFKDVTLLHGQKPIFKNTNWTIFKKQHWAIVGNERSGGEILAKALYQYMPTAPGKILYFFDPKYPETGKRYFEKGEVVRVSPTSYSTIIKKQAGYQQARWQSFEGSDSPTADELLTGRSIENRTQFHTEPQKVNEEIYRKRRDKAVALLNIEYLLNRKMLYLSSGETRKVLIARALMQAPKLLILDDPCGGLDQHSRNKLMEHLNNLLMDPDGPTVVVAAPRPDDVPDKIDNFAIIKDYRIDRTVSRKEYDNIIVAQTEKKSHKVQKYHFPKPLKQNWQTSLPKEFPLISIISANVKYGENTVLDNINWKVYPNENWAIIGSNGAGKSSLLSLVTGDCPQCHSNNIKVLGKRHGAGESIWNIRQQIGFICAESHTFHKGWDCRSVVLSGLFGSIGLHSQPTSQQQKQADKWMQCLNIQEYVDSTFEDISLLNQRLVLLARALIKDPAILILDEICQSLSIASGKKIISILDQLCQHQPPLSIICVSHHWDELPNLLDHVLYLKDGKIDNIRQLTDNSF